MFWRPVVGLPSPDLKAVPRRVEYIYIVHRHSDRFHPGTLTKLDRDATELPSQKLDVGPAVRELGFNITPIAGEEEHSLGEGVKVRVVAPHSGDTLFATDDGESVCINANDALHAASQELQHRFTQATRYASEILFLASRYGSNSALTYRLKRSIKKLLGLQQSYLCDFASWTAWTGAVSKSLLPPAAFPVDREIVGL
jgi:hypothetical protein